MSGERGNKPKLSFMDLPYFGLGPSSEDQKKSVEKSLDRRRVIEFEKQLRKKGSSCADAVRKIRESITYV